MGTAAISEVANFRALLGSLEVPDDPALQLEMVEQLRALQSAASAAIARVTVAFAKDRVAEAQDRNLPLRRQHAAATTELALVHRVSPSTMSRMLGAYGRLVTHLPATLRVLASGEASERAVLAVARTAHSLTAEDSARLDREIAPHIASLSPRQAEGRTRRFCQQADPETALRRLAMAESEATVSCRPVADGMARLSILAPTVEAVGMYAALRRDASNGQQEGQSLGRAMTSLAFQRITGLAAPSEMGVEIQLVMTDATLLRSLWSGHTGEGEPTPGSPLEAGLATAPPDEPGRVADPTTGITDAWLPADTVREIALGEGPRFIRRLLTDRVTGTLRAADGKRRKFTAEQRRFIAIRDQYCTTPYCGAPIRDLDHALPHARGGPTDTANGNGKCQRCNLTKDLPGFRTKAIAGGRGRSPGIELTTPAGRTYTSSSPPVLARPPKRPATSSRQRASLIIDFNVTWAA